VCLSVFCASLEGSDERPPSSSPFRARGSMYMYFSTPIPFGQYCLISDNCARFSNLHWLLFGGLQDWGSCHLRKENFRVEATARWRKDTEEDTPSLRRTFYSDQTHATVNVKGKFLGMYS
jgi:hypothetical protein